MLVRHLFPLLLLLFLTPGQAMEKALRVAVLHHSPPMSYIDDSGTLTGFSVEIMQALCDVMDFRCEPVPMTLERVIEAVASGEVDFAAVSLLATPERRARVLMTKPYYRSLSVWFARPGVAPGATKVAVVRGGAQARHAQARGWAMATFDKLDDMIDALARGSAGAALLPLTSAVALKQDPRIRDLRLASTPLLDPGLAGEVCLGVNPRAPELVERLNEAIDRIKRDGRFDRINSRFIPFRLQ